MSQTRSLIEQGDALVSAIFDALAANEEAAPAERRAEEEIFAEHLAALQALDLSEVDLVARLAAVVRAARGREEILTAERDRVQASRDRWRRTADRCTGAIGQLLEAREARGLDAAVELPDGKVRMQVNSAARLEAPRDIAWWEATGFADYSPRPNEAALREALREGVEVDGARLVRGRHVRLPGKVKGKATNPEGGE